ncbi:MAG TPA: DUF6662 family protein [Steroidobacteraceae bacterium]|jgi:hypothetical protein
MNTFSMKLLLAAAGMLSVAVVQAGEEIFPETYLTETLPRGVFEVEHAITYQANKSEGDYRLWQNRSEIEYGITDRWLAALYINTYSVTAQNDNSQASRRDFTSGGGDGDEVLGGGPGTFGQYVLSSTRLPIPAARYSKTDFDSLSVETIYQLLSPFTDVMGLAGYLEYSKGPRTQELEMKLLAQKDYLQDRLVLAANAVVEFERNAFALADSWERETEVEFTGGASYRFASNWRAGAELRNIRGYNGHSIDSNDRSYSVWFFGPQLSYTAARWFATLGYQRQMPWASAYDHAAQLEQVGGLNYKEFEANFVRLKIGFNFK